MTHDTDVMPGDEAGDGYVHLMAADELILYHGTNDPESALQGLRAGTCVAADSDLAWYYAEVSEEESGGTATVIMVRVGIEGLDPDIASFSEPVGYAGRSSKSIEEDVEAHGDQPVDASVTLRLVGSARLRAAAPASTLSELQSSS
jgi:hypothetical protein